MFSMSFILSACSILPHHEVPAAVDCEDKRIAIIPFAVATPKDRLNHYSSETGNRYARTVNQIVRARSGAKVVDAESLKREITGFNVGRPDWSKICRNHKLDLIVVPTIRRFEMSDPRNHGFIRGIADIHVLVVNGDNEILLDNTLRNIVYPKPISPDPEFDVPGGHALRTSPAEVRAGLDKEIIQQVAWLFYDHEEPKD